MSAAEELLRELLFSLAVYRQILLPLNASRVHLKSYLRSNHNEPLQFYVGMDRRQSQPRPFVRLRLAASRNGVRQEPVPQLKCILLIHFVE